LFVMGKVMCAKKRVCSREYINCLLQKKDIESYLLVVPKKKRIIFIGNRKCVPRK